MQERDKALQHLVPRWNIVTTQSSVTHCSMASSGGAGKDDVDEDDEGDEEAGDEV